MRSQNVYRLFDHYYIVLLDNFCVKRIVRFIPQLNNEHIKSRYYKNECNCTFLYIFQ